MSDRYGNVRVTKIKAALDAHRAAVYSGDPEAILETWRTFEQWADIVFRAITPAEAARVMAEAMAGLSTHEAASVWFKFLDDVARLRAIAEGKA